MFCNMQANWTLTTRSKAQKINEKIAGIVNKLRLQRITQEQSKAIMKRHIKPENVGLGCPNVNKAYGMKFPAKLV